MTDIISCSQPALISCWNSEEPSMVVVVLNLSRPNPTPSVSEEDIVNLSNKRPAFFKIQNLTPHLTSKWYTFFFRARFAQFRAPFAQFRALFAPRLRIQLLSNYTNCMRIMLYKLQLQLFKVQHGISHLWWP